MACSAVGWTVVSPVDGGFVCGAGASDEWVELVAKVWRAYYTTAAIAGREGIVYGFGGCGCGSRLHVGDDGEVVACERGTGGSGRWLCAGSDVGNGGRFEAPRVGCTPAVCGQSGLSASGPDGVQSDSTATRGAEVVEVRSAGCVEQMDNEGCEHSVGEYSGLETSVMGSGCGGLGDIRSARREEDGNDESRRGDLAGGLGVDAVRPVGECPGTGRGQSAANRRRRGRRARKAGATEPVVPVPQRGSFFSRCDDVIRKKLETSRAKRLIAENEAAELCASRFVARDDEAEGLVRQMIVRMELEKKVSKLAETSRIGNWAKTVAGGHASTINSPALSKVPSLESVGLGSSVSNDESVKREARLALYSENRRLLECNLESQPYLLPDQVEDAYRALVNEFEDVLFTPEENTKRKIADMIQDDYASYGINSVSAKLLVDKLSEGISYNAL